MSLGPKDLIIAVLAVTTSSLIIFGQASLDAAARSFPVSVFSVSSGLFLMWRGRNVIYKLAGVALCTSPFWLLPVIDLIVRLVTEAVA